MPGQGTPKIRTKRRLASLPPALRPIWPYAKRLYTFAVEVIAPFTRALSRLRGGYLPHSVARTVTDVAKRGEGQMRIAYGEQRLARAIPAGSPPSHPAFVSEAIEDVPRVAVAELPGGRVLGPYRAVITGAGAFVDELSPYFGTTRPSQHPVFTHPFPPEPTRVEGRVGVLAARCDAAYYHYVTDVLPRLAILEGLESPPERFYMPASLSFQEQLIELVGIDRDRVIDSDQIRHIEAEMLIVPGLPDVNLKTPPWLVEFVRSRLLPPGTEPVAGRRIYITRGSERGTRVVLNEDEVVEALAERGFTVVEPGSMRVAEQIGMFAEAEWIVAPHGGALTNLAFASAGASVIELFAPDYVQGCYWKLSDCVPGLTYRYLVGTGRAPRSGRMAGVDSDMTIEVRSLLALIDGLHPLPTYNPAADGEPGSPVALRLTQPR